MPKGNAGKAKASSNDWSTSVDDFTLWDDEDAEEARDDRPLLQTARGMYASSRSSAQSTDDHDKPEAIRSAAPSRTTMSLERSISAAAGSVSAEPLPLPKAPASESTTMIEAPANTSRKAWQYTRPTPKASVPSAVHKMPTVPTPSIETAAKQADALPQYAYRKQSALRGPVQQTMRAPFAEVVNADTRRTVEARRPGVDHPPSHPPVNQRYASSSSASSRIFDSTSTASSHTLASSSPHNSSITFPDRGSSVSSTKRPAPPRSEPSPKRPAPARVTCRPGITKQSILGFTPVQHPPYREKEPISPLSIEPPHHGPYIPAPSAPSRFRSPSYRMSPPQNTPRQSPSYLTQAPGYRSLPHQDDRDMMPHSSYSSMAYTPMMNNFASSSRSAVDEAVDREFYQTFRSSPARDRIAADYQASRGTGDSNRSRFQARSEEERRLLQYPQVFNQDPASTLKKSKQKLASFAWSTAQKKSAAITKPVLPFTPRQGAASRWKSREVLDRAAREQARGIQQQQELPRSAPRSNGRSYHQAISVSSEASDEFDCDFDFGGIREEDLARLEEAG